MIARTIAQTMPTKWLPR
jgi:hypothetical protein